MVNDFDVPHVDFDAVDPTLGVASGGLNAASMVFGLEWAIGAFGEDMDDGGLFHGVSGFLWIPANNLRE